jgi:GNAT superfamily N-acetyltransferase
MTLVDRVELSHRLADTGFVIQAVRDGEMIGELKILAMGDVYALYTIYVRPAYRGQSVAKLLYRSALRQVIASGKKLCTTAERTAEAEGLCRKLHELGRATPIYGEQKGRLVLSTETTERALPEPERDERGRAFWPVTRWWLDPNTKNVDDLDQAGVV